MKTVPKALDRSARLPGSGEVAEDRATRLPLLSPPPPVTAPVVALPPEAAGRAPGNIAYGGRREVASLALSGAVASATLGAFQMAAYASPTERRLDELTDHHRHAGLFPAPSDPRADAGALRKDLRTLPGTGTPGLDVYQKLMAHPGLDSAQKERVLAVLAEVRGSLLRREAAIPEGTPAKGYQTVNWNHTRAEIDQVLDAGMANGLAPRQLEDALIASMISDAVKSPDNFIVHNIHAAQAAPDILTRYFDPAKPGNLDRIAGICQAIKEHQIGPPRFMAMIAKGMINKQLGPSPSAEDRAALERLSKKIADPLNTLHQTKDHSRLDFTAGERALLGKIGVEEWWVPHPGTEWSAASRALIDGDSLVNYSTPEGFAKIAAIRGPDRGPFFEDATIFQSLASARQSYDDALTVISPKAKPLAEAQLAGTEAAIERAKAKLETWLTDQKSRIPYDAEGKIPFWSSPLKYASKGELSPVEKKQTELAKELRDRFVELLRSEQGVSR